MGIIVNVSKSKMLVERLDRVMDDKTNRDYALYLTILILSLSIIIYQTVNYSLFPIQYAHGTTTSYNNERTVSAGQQVKINASKTGSSAGGPIEMNLHGHKQGDHQYLVIIRPLKVLFYLFRRQ